ncbi:MAG: methyltransferase domain-containing protein [Planctomycetota bacterium]|jgi:SAM-dependent methyltransferase
MNEHDLIRRRVAGEYARIIGIPPRRCNGAKAPQKGTAVKVAGYRQTELDALPDDAVVNAMGCGNPVAFAGVQPGDVVVDLGSGAGIDLLLAARKVGTSGRVIGIDMTEAMIDRARENIARSGLRNVEVRRGLIEDLPVAEASVDWLISNCVVNLSPEKTRVFREIARVLRPGGRMVISDIVVETLPDDLRLDVRSRSRWMAGAIGEGAYREGLADAGLVDISVDDRWVYTASQLEAMLAPTHDDEGQHDDQERLAAEAGAIARQLAGRVWSARFSARRPPRRG